MSTGPSLQCRLQWRVSQSPQTGPFMSTKVLWDAINPRTGRNPLKRVRSCPPRIMPAMMILWASRNPLKRVRSCPRFGSVTCPHCGGSRNPLKRVRSCPRCRRGEPPRRKWSRNPLKRVRSCPPNTGDCVPMGVDMSQSPQTGPFMSTEGVVKEILEER